MRFGFDEDQVLMADSVGRQFQGLFTSDTVAAFRRDRIMPAAWLASLAEAGLIGLCASPEAGGLGLGAVHCIPAMMALGRTLAPFPLAEAIVAAAALGTAMPDKAAEMIGGSLLATMAWEGAVGAEPGGEGWRLSGLLPRVPFAADAAILLAFASLGGARRLVALDLDSPGIKFRPLDSVDKTFPLFDVALDSVVLPGQRVLPHDDEAIAALLRLGGLLVTAELFGAAEAAFDQAVSYAKDRTQFEKPIGANQALKHLLADSATTLEAIRVATFYAAWAHDASAEDAAMSAHIAKAYASEGARSIAEDAIQVHGGIGFTWEFGLHFLLRRIMRGSVMLGTAYDHRRAIAATLASQFAA